MSRVESSKYENTMKLEEMETVKKEMITVKPLSYKPRHLPKLEPVEMKDVVTEYCIRVKRLRDPEKLKNP